MLTTCLAGSLALASLLPEPFPQVPSRTAGTAPAADAEPRLLPRYESPPAVPFARPAGPADPAQRLGDGARERPRVDPATGELRFACVDLRVPSVGMDFVLARTYRSITGPDSALGHRWDLSYDLWIEAHPAGVIVHDGNGRADLFRPDASGTYTAPERFQEGFYTPEITFELRFEDDGRWIFHPLDGGEPWDGRIASIVDRNGNAMQFEYDGAGRLTTIRDTLDRAYALEHSPAGRLTAVVDFAGRRVEYAHYEDGEAGGGAGDLKSVTTPAVLATSEFPIPPGHEAPGATTVYTYATGQTDPRLAHQLLSITDPEGRTFASHVYELGEYWVRATGRVKRQWLGGAVTDWVWLPARPSPANGNAVLRVIRNDRRGTVDELFYDVRNRLRVQREHTGFADPALPTTATENRPQDPLRPDDPPFFETRWTWNREALPTRVVHPNGNETRRVYEVDLDPAAPARRRADLREVRRLPGSHLPAGDQAELVETFEYDAAHAGGAFVTRHVDARGNATTHEYDAAGNRTRTVHRLPDVVEDFEYDALGRLTRHVRPDNGSGWRREDVTTWYGPADGAMNGYRKERIVDAAGLALATSWTYDAVGHVTSVTDPRGSRTDYVVDQRDRVVLELMPEATPGSGVRRATEVFSSSGFDEVMHIAQENRDELGALRPNTHLTTTLERDLLGHVTAVHREVADGVEVVEAFEYDASENLVLVRKGEATSGTQPDNVVRTLYDERDLVFAVVRGDGGPDRSETRSDYDGNGNERAVRAGVGPTERLTLRVFDGYDRRVLETDPMGNVVESHYDANGNTVSERIDGEPIDVPGGAGNARLSETTWTYDAMDRVVHRAVAWFDETGAPLGDGASDTAYGWTPCAELASVTDDNGHATTLLYDGAERVDVVTDPRGNRVTRAYDAGSNVVQVDELEVSDLGGPDRLFTTTLAYDGLDRLVEVVRATVPVTGIVWDFGSNPVEQIDARGVETRREYDGLGRLVRSARDADGDGADPADPDDAVEAFAWDASSRLVVRTDPMGYATTYAYDALDRRIAVQLADGTVRTTSYDVHDDAVETVDANGSRITTLHDSLGRRIDVDVLPGAGVSPQTTFETFAWDGLSRLVAATDDDSTVARTYDSLGSLRSEAQGAWSVAASHDGVGNRTALAYPGGRALATAYDVLDRPVTIADGSGTLVTLAYEGPRRRVQRTYANGATTTWLHDDLRRVVATAHASPVSFPPVFDGRNHVLDAAGLVLATTETHPQGEARTYVHDALGRLAHSQRTPSIGPPVTVDYAYDLAGNRSLVNGGPDAGPYTLDATLPAPADAQVHQYTTEPGGTRAYDDAGNLVAVVGSSTETYVHDARDRLVERHDTATGRTDTWTYDALGRRIERVLDALGSPQTTRFVFDGEDVIEERDGGGILLADLIVEENGVLPNYVRRGGVDAWLHADARGRVVAATGAAGQVVERYRYSDFGRVTFLDPAGNPRPASVIGNEHLYLGRREAGLYAVGRRLLDPRVGRLTTRDLEQDPPVAVRGVAVDDGLWYLRTWGTSSDNYCPRIIGLPTDDPAPWSLATSVQGPYQLYPDTSFNTWSTDSDNFCPRIITRTLYDLIMWQAPHDRDSAIPAALRRIITDVQSPYRLATSVQWPYRLAPSVQGPYRLATSVQAPDQLHGGVSDPFKVLTVGARGRQVSLPHLVVFGLSLLQPDRGVATALSNPVDITRYCE